MCAGPGGKAALLSRWAYQKDARFLALEISEHRAALMTRMTSEIVVADGTKAPLAPESAAKILIDAPCSGLGALRRRPDARIRKLPSELPGLVAIQRQLLESAAELLIVGGVMAYITCSPVAAETTGNIQWFTQSNPTFELIDARPYFPTEMDVAERFDVQLWPGVHHTDAMYVALLQKKSSTR
jgi:16S rRNA (cytosine967-C5)-methyltransferase